MNSLEDGNAAANLLSVDFEKAFNRMDHAECLLALRSLGASETAIEWVSAFLYGRKMSVKIRSSFSNPRPVPGGSPQGSILGIFLFCATTNCFANIDVEQNFALQQSSSDGSFSYEQISNTSPINQPRFTSSTPTARGQFANFRPPRCLQQLDVELLSDEDSFEFFKAKKRYSFDSFSDSNTDNSDGSYKYQLPPTVCQEPVKTLVYIDDYNSIERVRLSEAMSHITERKRKLKVIAQKSEKIFQGVQGMADNMA